jgi:hypothetical protein
VKLRQLAAVSVAAIGVLATAGTASATTFTANVDPSGSGTTSAPKAQNVTFDLQRIKAGPDGNPTTGVVGLDEIMAPEFASGFDHFAVCAKDVIASASRDQPNCPADSVLGTAAAKLYVPAVAGSSTTDRGFMYKTGSDTFAAWLHVSQPVEVGAALYGVLKPASNTTGITASWDFTPAGKAQNSQHVEIRAVSWKTVWAVPGQTVTAPPSKTATAPSSKKKHKRETCVGKARKIKNRQKREQRIKACRRAAAKRKHSSAKKRSQGTARAAAASEFSPFMSTGCSAGSWTLQAHLTYADGSDETLQSSVSCASGAGQGGSPGGGILPPCGIPPICSSSAAGGAQVAEDERVRISP